MREQQIEMPDGKILLIRQINPYINELSIKSTRTILIGKLDKNTGELLIFRDRSKHEHIKTSSYGFNSWLMHNSTTIKTIRIEEKNGDYHNTYKITRQALLHEGLEMNFIGERQIFYPIRQLETFYKL